MRQCMDADNLHRRLKKIIGQVQAIDRMVDEDVPCEDVLSQINAAKSALHKCGQVVLEGHIQHCVRDGIQHGDADKTIESFTKAGGRIVGYGNVEDTGYLDHLFVRWDCQGQGIAAALCDALEAHCRELGVDAVTVHASKTALPFFLGRGYAIEREQQVPCRGQVLTNYALEKIL